MRDDRMGGGLGEFENLIIPQSGTGFANGGGRVLIIRRLKE